jgi:hypothetical protein
MLTKRRLLFLIISLILTADTAYSFWQHYHTPLYGDMSQIILTTRERGYNKLMQDPFGFRSFASNEKYISPNRFFAHWTTMTYFKNSPGFLQRFTTPVNSVYLSAALAKILVQLLLIYVLAVCISNSKRVLKYEFLLAAVLITPLFQTAGYTRYIGIIDPSVLYSFFYALPIGLLLIFFLPFFKHHYYNQDIKLNPFVKILLLALIVFLSLNGPLIPGIVLILCPLVLVVQFIDRYKTIHNQAFKMKVVSVYKSMSKTTIFYFIFFSLACLYSLYIGKNNVMNFTDTISLKERYLKIPEGIYILMTNKIGLPLLLSLIIINSIIIRKHYKTDETKKMLSLINGFAIFSVLYILLLPLGGYRVYRPFIVRYDTIIPVTIGLFLMFGLTTFYLIKTISKKYKFVYITSIVLFLLNYEIADITNTKGYNCEREAINKISNSTYEIVVLECDCPVMDWKKIENPQSSKLNAELFQYWNITKTKKLYYHKIPGKNE